MHSDRFIEGNKTMKADFLGEKALFPAALLFWPATFKVPVSFVFALKETALHYHFFASAIKDYSKLGKENGPQANVEMISLAEMETKVKQYPEQWYNYYNFWQQ